MISQFSVKKNIYDLRFSRKLVLALFIIIISVIAQNTLVLRLALGETEALRIGFGAFFTILGGILLGPLWGAFIGGTSDLVSFAFYPAGPYLFQITLVSALRGALPGRMARSLTGDYTKVRNLVLLIGVPQVLCSVILMPLVLYEAFGIPVVANMGTRLLTQSVTIPLYIFVLYILLKQWKFGETLQESEEKHRSIFEFSPLGIMHFNEQGVITDCNRAMAELLGSTRKAMSGLNLLELPDKEIVAVLHQSLKGEQGYFEGKYPAAISSGDIYVRAYFNPIVTNNKVSGGAGIVEDVSERLLLEKKLRFLADTDDLTGLGNRRYFIQVVQREMERVRRYGEIFSLILMDVDNFKKVNDTWGHGAGDAVLRYLSKIIKKRLRQPDIPGRLGGEEFCVLLPGTDSEGAVILAEGLRQTIEETPAYVDEKQIFLTVSMGVTTCRDNVDSVDELLRMADNALYEAKARGKNCTAKVINC